MPRHVSAHGDKQAHCFYDEAGGDEDSPTAGIGEEHERGDDKKKSCWHDQQSGVFHVLPLQGLDAMEQRLPDPGLLWESASGVVL